MPGGPADRHRREPILSGDRRTVRWLASYAVCDLLRSRVGRSRVKTGAASEAGI